MLLAPRCAACGESLDHPSAGPVCLSCWTSIVPLRPPLCDVCGEPVASARAALVAAAGDPGGRPVLACPACRHLRSEIAVTRSAGEYDGALRRVLHAVKYEGRRSLAGPLARLMRERGQEALDGAEIAVPVPLHWRRRIARGFNQAEDLSRGLGLPVCRPIRRRRPTRPQFGLRPGARQRNVEGAFCATRRWLGGPSADARRVRGACVLLVDDVATTGATLRECAAVLKALGAREVRALTAARALRQRG